MTEWVGDRVPPLDVIPLKTARAKAMFSRKLK